MYEVEGGRKEEREEDEVRVLAETMFGKFGIFCCGFSSFFSLSSTKPCHCTNPVAHKPDAICPPQAETFGF